MIYNNIKWLNIAMHDAVRVSEIKSLQDFVGVKADVDVIEALGDNFSLYVGDVLKYEAGRLRNRISEHII